MKPVFDITLGQSGTDSKVFVNGVDITSAIRGVSVECLAGGLTAVSLQCAHGSTRTRVMGAIERVNVDGETVVTPEETP